MFHTSSEGLIEDPSVCFEEDKFHEDLLADCPVSEGKKDFLRGEVRGNDDECRSNTKKSAHKFVERERRKEMTALYASLRSLLPREYVKGKRAISDHMHQAVNYINDMKKRIEEMQVRREKLRGRSFSGGGEDDRIMMINGGYSPNGVMINVSRDGVVEILITSSFNEDSSLPLSRVLADLLSRQLDVVDYVSTRGDQCYFHKIQIELNDSTSMDLSELQEGLEQLIEFVCMHMISFVTSQNPAIIYFVSSISVFLVVVS